MTLTTEDGITVGLDDRITVKLEDGVTVATDESATETADEGVIWSAEDGVTRCDALREEIATTSADIVEVTALEPATTLAVLVPLLMETVPDENSTLTTEDGVIERAEDGVNCNTDDGVMLAADDSVTVPDETATALVKVTCTADEGVTDTAPPTEEIATTSAGIVDVTALDPAETQAVLPPFIMVNAPDETEATAMAEDGVTVAEEIATLAVRAEEGVIVTAPPNVDSATVRADMVEVMGLEPAVTHAVLLPLIRAI